MAKIVDIAHKRKRKPSIIKAGNYEDLPSHLQRDIDRVNKKVNQRNRGVGSGSSLQQRIKNILFGN